MSSTVLRARMSAPSRICAIRNIVRGQSLEITTSIALSVTFVMGVLIGQGHFLAPIAAAILVTMILPLKTELTRFAGGLRPEEIRSGVLLGLIGFCDLSDFAGPVS